ncbi:MAG: isoleucine--tRNA ligase [Euryarchaeota archaeon]|nr:isoleucine--tRNA ligase [Euryarchaeota archaeon]
MVQAPPKKYDPKAFEEEVIAKWRDEDTFRRSVEGRRGAEPFVFLEGPPTANGLPHPGHVLTRTLKDTVCRFRTMRGRFVERKAGWDCHGLPVEIEVQKEKGLKDVRDIEAYGIERFNADCRESVFRYKDVWERMSERVGFWLDFDDPYVTMDDAYIESVWWSLKTLHEKGLLFKDYKVLPYCPQTGTSYSSHEVAQGYKTVEDLSVFVKFRLKDDTDDAAVLSWTTTPWTLPGNVALAVGKDIEYVKVRVTKPAEKAHAEVGEVLILAKALMKNTLRHETEILETFPGSRLVGKAYEPLFPGAVDTTGSDTAHTILEADFVTTEDGTGVVHTAVMYGEDDFRLGEQKGLPKQHTVDLRGCFVASVGEPLAGRYVKDVDDDVAGLLRGQGLLYRTERYEHQYPHCWRTGHPLLYYAMESWYVKMSGLREELLAANDSVDWHPDHIKEGRFGEWLRNVKDWAISRKRFWGTPMPVWLCHGKGDAPLDGCGKEVMVGSREELQAFAGNVPDDLHRPYIDIDVPCDDCGGTMRREPYVIDTWYDSGSAHFAQWHHPKGTVDRADHFPVDFIAEGIDQTRGWFYTLIATGVALFDQATYRNVMVNGLVLAEDGQKMSKSKRNYTDPGLLFETLGADAVRWTLLTTSAPWADKRFFEGAVREALSKFLLTLWNSYSFFSQYASLDGWTRADIANAPALDARPRIDRWLLDRTYAACEEAADEMDRFHLHKATRVLESFVVDDLSNWYVRRVRRRLWGEGMTEDKAACYATLHECLLAVVSATAPFAPFLTEKLYMLIRDGEGPDSVHLADWPERSYSAPEELVDAMATVRGLVEAGRALRAKVDIGVRWPLPEAVLVPTPDAKVGPEALAPLLSVFQEEMNTKGVTTAGDLDRFLEYRIAPEPGRIGPRFKQHARQVSAAIDSLDPAHWGPIIERGEKVPVHVEGEELVLEPADFRLEKVEAEGYASTKAEGYVLVLDTHQTPELKAEGLARELVRRIQDMRKELDLHVEDQIEVAVAFDKDPGVPVQDHEATIREETRARALHWTRHSDDVQVEKSWTLELAEVTIQVLTVVPARPEEVAT